MSEHLYSIGDVVNGLIITEQCYKMKKEGRKKGYKYKCIKCGYDCGEHYKSGVYYSEHIIMENNLKKGAGCAVCSNNGFVVPHINSIHAKTPWIEQYLINKDDAIKYSPRSNQRLQCKCLDCGKEYVRSCSKLLDYGIACPCGDGFSYPEKFVFNMLTQLKVKFKPQYCFDSSLLRYDFYLYEYNLIIEVHGIQHYKQKWERDESKNDIQKKEFAIANGISEEMYIVLDCRESNLEFIKQSILNSQLGILLDCNSVDFIQCAEFASNNLVKRASELWEEGCSIMVISERLCVHKHTVITYLKQGDDVRWCHYKPGDGFKRIPAEQRIKNFYKNKESIKMEEIL